MIICATCGTEMTCAKNGVGLDYGLGCVHQADCYKCECGAAVLVGNPRETVDPEYVCCDWYFQVHEANMNAEHQYAPIAKRWALAGRLASLRDEELDEHIRATSERYHAALDALHKAIAESVGRYNKRKGTQCLKSS